FARGREPMVADVDVVALLDEVLAILPPPTGVEVERAAVDGEIIARLDRDMMRQVLLNLVGNAYQAMPDGGRLSVSVASSGGALRCEVRATGGGREEEPGAGLCEPFFTTKARGIGLGLVVCKRIVEAHGGRLTAESEPGRGSRFDIILPDIAPPRETTESVTV